MTESERKDADIAIIRYGGQGLLPVKAQLRAGDLTAELLEDGTLRAVRVGGEKILSSIYPTVRDEHWGTIPTRFMSFKVRQDENSFRVEFKAEHRNDIVHYEWNGTIEGHTSGFLTYRMEGEARNDFRRNRIGLCLLHPMEMAGTSLIVETTDGMREGEFADLITPDDPYTDMKTMQFRMKSGLDVQLKFEGDLFHMEDQRNWTDASYKTFCTPLHIPYPVQLTLGDRVEQSVTLWWEGEPANAAAEQILTLKVTNESVGILPGMGVRLTADTEALSAREMELLTACRFSILRLPINLSDFNWKEALWQANETARELKLDFELEVHTDDVEQRISDLISFIHASNIQISRMSLYPASGFDQTEPVPVKCALFGASYQAVQFVTKHSHLQAASKYLQEHNISVPIGGGSRANFTEFNRAVLPLELMDYAEYAINPQVHAFDLVSLAETLNAQALTVRTAKVILQDCQRPVPLHINSVSLKQRINPYAANEQGVSQSQNAQADARLHSLFGAGWTLGSIRQLSEYGVESINYYDALGPIGIVPATDKPLPPVYHLFTELAKYKNAELLKLDINVLHQFEALGLQAGNKIMLLVANLTNNPQTISIDAPSLAQATVRIMDETLDADQEISFAVSQQASKLFKIDKEIRLLPFAIVCIET